MFFVLLLAGLGNALKAPQNLLDLYDTTRAKGRCSHELATGFYSTDGGSNNFAYCGDRLSTSGIIYLQGRHGTLANLDVDCDGTGTGSNGTASPSNDGRCRVDLSPDTQNTTTFRDTLAGYGHGLTDLNPYVHPYVVFGNARGTHNRRGWKAFDPTAHGMRPLSVMAVVCPNREMVYGIWGDTNGDDGDKPMVGEASLALVTACGGKNVTGGNGIDEDTTLFVGFVGEDAVPGANGANWSAQDFDTFEKSIQPLGNQLVERVRPDEEDASSSVRLGWSEVAFSIAVVLFSRTFLWS
ncbi:glycoside hydrolase family 75 protein [Chaetomium sp. MPI-SDFR-AT-0129]|nr:glycoside hydrolase family 75 protein [Chaetomium sp. MPI-SDFR-AT-0129]